MKKLYKILISFLILLIFMSCGKAIDDLGLRVVSAIPSQSQKNVNIDTEITIIFNKPMEKVHMALINTESLSGEVLGETRIDGKNIIFKPNNPLLYNIKYKVNIHNLNTISISKQSLKETFSYTFTTKKVDTIPTIPEEEDNTTTNETNNDTNTNQSYSTCDLIPQMNCDDIKKIDTN